MFLFNMIFIVVVAPRLFLTILLLIYILILPMFPSFDFKFQLFLFRTMTKIFNCNNIRHFLLNFRKRILQLYVYFFVVNIIIINNVKYRNV